MCLMTVLPHYYFLLKKMREPLAMQKLLTFFQQKILQCKSFSHFFNKKYWCISHVNVINFNKMLTNDVVSFDQLDQEL